MKEKILGQIQTSVFDNQHLIGLPKHWKIDSAKSLEFEVKINEKNQLVLSSMCLVSQDKTNNSISGETDSSDNTI